METMGLCKWQQILYRQLYRGGGVLPAGTFLVFMYSTTEHFLSSLQLRPCTYIKMLVAMQLLINGATSPFFTNTGYALLTHVTRITLYIHICDYIQITLYTYRTFCVYTCEYIQITLYICK
jgi:hypothetical protein